MLRTYKLQWLLVSTLVLGLWFLIHEARAGKEEVQGQGLHSYYHPWKETLYNPDYYRFSNVKLSGDELIFYTTPDSSANASQQPPESFILNLDESQVTITVRQVPLTSDSGCSRTITEPTILQSGTPWDNNFYEMIVNAVMPMWSAARMQGMLDPERYLSTEQKPGEEGAFLMVQGLNETFASPWNYTFDYMTPKRALRSEVDGCCFSDITLISTSILRYLNFRSFDTVEKHNLYEHKRRQLFKEFRRWLFRVEQLYRRSVGHPKPPRHPDSVPYARPRVVFSSRPSPYGYQSRGITNEPEVVKWIEDNYDVNVTLIDFGGPLEDAIELVQSCSVFMGMHGAGMTYAMWMKPGSHFLQMAPYGWHQDWDGRLIRGDYFERMARDAGSSSSHWTNPHPHKAFFHKEHFEEKDGEPFEHPTKDTPLPKDWNPGVPWIYQTTEVDTESFGRAFDHAMRMVNIPRRYLS